MSAPANLKPRQILRFQRIQLEPPQVLDEAQVLFDPQRPPAAGQSPWLEVAQVETLYQGEPTAQAEVIQIPLMSPEVLEPYPFSELVALKAILGGEETVTIFPPGDPCPLDERVNFHEIAPPEIRKIPTGASSPEALPKVSENLIAPLPEEISIEGMNYASRYWRPIVLKADGIGRIWLGFRAPEGFVHPLPVQTLSDPHLRVRVSYWDHIFPILQEVVRPSGRTGSLPQVLDPHQFQGVQFLTANQHALVEYDPGCGQMEMAIIALKMLMHAGAIQKALVVCPPRILFEWKRNFETWAPELVTVFVSGDQELRQAIWNSWAHVYLAAFDTLNADSIQGLAPLDFDLILLDGAHHIKNPATSLSREIRKFNAQYRWAFTSAQVHNRLDDLVALFLFVYPGFMGSVYLSLDQVRQKIAPFFLRRSRSDVKDTLPAKVHQDLWLELDSSQRQVYDQAEKAAIAEIKKLGAQVTRDHLNTMIQKLKQICDFLPNHPHSPKLEQLLNQVEEIAASGHKVVIFTHYVHGELVRLEENLYKFGIARIYQGQGSAERRVEVERFKRNKETTVMIASSSSWETELDLSEAAYVIHFDHPWNPAVMWRAEERIFPQGVHNPVHVTSYWMLKTVDERIAALLDQKGVLFTQNMAGMSADDFDELLTIADLKSILGVKKPTTPSPYLELSNWRILSEDQIRARLVNIDATEFEALLMTLMNYFDLPNVEQGESPSARALTLFSRRPTEKGPILAAVQGWRSRTSLKLGVAQDFAARIHQDPHIQQALLVSTNDFSPDCADFCSRNNIEMIPGQRLAKIIQEL